MDSKSFVSCLKKCIEIKGAKILNDIAETIEIDQKKLTLKSGNNINYDNLIVSAGPWTKELIYSSGANINIYPAKGEIIKLVYTSIMGLALIIFTLTGFWLWYGPKLIKKNKKNI